jgi:hypothetical protein
MPKPATPKPTPAPKPPKAPKWQDLELPDNDTLDDLRSIFKC